MRWPLIALLAGTLAGCSSPPPLPPGLASLMAETPEGAATRLLVAGNDIVAASVPLGPGSVPSEVRAAIDAVVPRGETTFRGREWSRRGEGYRIEKLYRNGGEEQVRTALIADDGRVLERAHSVPLRDVPQPILTAALGVGHDVVRALIVSGREREEYWSCIVGDRLGRTHVVRVDLGGSVLAVMRRVTARVDI